MDTATRLAARFQALADPTRLRLLHYIATGEPTASDCVLHLRQSQPRVARHLRVLIEAGLLVARREGRFVHYALASSGGGEVLARAALAVLAAEAPAGPAASAPTREPPLARAGTVARTPPAPAPEAEAPMHRPMEDFLL